MNKKVGCGEILLSTWNAIKSRATQNGWRRKNAKKKKFTITIKYIWELFLKQDRKCALSGVELTFRKNRTERDTASLDRIDSSKGYIKENVQWVHKDVNNMKQNLDQDEFLSLCAKVSKYNV